MDGNNAQAQPTQRRKTISTFLLPPTVILRSRSMGARSPTLGHSAMGIGAGGGESHGWTVKGRALTDIQAGQPAFSSCSSRPGMVPGGRSDLVFCSFLACSGSGDEKVGKLNASLGIPIFLIASLVARLENILAILLRHDTQRGTGFQ